jgi:hypothetical protein
MSQTFEGEIERISELKTLGEAGKLKSIGILLKGDTNWRNITEFSEEKIKTILGDAKIGEHVRITTEEVRGFQNVKKVERVAQKPQTPEMDFMTPVGNLYAMCEEKLNAIMEQNAFYGLEIAILKDLTFKIAEKVGIDLSDFKKADELDNVEGQ